ncbi:MAG: hypothetical protein ABS999_15190, partial [Pseudomonas atacamensis]|uniref:hypothetical protein n=1 Tax=Pseudomonas atacamensis TaxID=2565368 RepID=UPI00331544AD
EYVLFDAPLTMLCDSPSNYSREPECLKFIAGVPTVWDKTVALAGKAIPASRKAWGETTP